MLITTVHRWVCSTQSVCCKPGCPNISCTATPNRISVGSLARTLSSCTLVVRKLVSTNSLGSPTFAYVPPLGPIFDAHDIRVLIIPGSIGIVAAIMCMSVSTGKFQAVLAGLCPTDMSFQSTTSSCCLSVSSEDPQRACCSRLQFLLSVIGSASAELLPSVSHAQPAELAASSSRF
jgi:hypothetical protein